MPFSLAVLPKVCPAVEGPVGVALAAVLDSHLRDECMPLHVSDLVAAADARIPQRTSGIARMIQVIQVPAAASQLSAFASCCLRIAREPWRR
jgi:hypothetical protein